MTIHTAARACLLAVIVIGLLGTAGTAGTLAAFFDAGVGNGSFSTAEDFGGVPPESMDQAFNDSNGNGYYDDGEENTYNSSELANFDEPNANLVIPENVGAIDDQSGVSISAESIDSRVDIQAEYGDVELTATSGDIDLAGTELTGFSAGIDISASGNLTVDSAILRKQHGEISLEGARISAIGTHFETSNSPITLTSDFDVNLNASRFESNQGDASITLGSNSRLFVDQSVISDRDSRLVYSPSSVTVIGSPANGNLSL